VAAQPQRLFTRTARIVGSPQIAPAGCGHRQQFTAFTRVSSLVGEEKRTEDFE
jgi:hypothetical protein